MLSLTQPHILSLDPYVPGRAIENSSTIPGWAKLGSNENCLGASPMAIEAATKSLTTAHLYPNAKRLSVIAKICQHLGDFSVKPTNVALGNGLSEIIVNLVRGLLAPSEAMLYGSPTFVMYRLAARAHEREAIGIPCIDDFGYDLDGMIRACNAQAATPIKLIFLANPNNPTGAFLTRDELDGFVAEIPRDTVLVIDEAYCEYVMRDDYPNALPLALSRPRTLVLRTFSKVYGLAGMRLGYAIGDPAIIDVLCRIRDPFNVNSIVQHAAIAALDDKHHVERSVRHNLEYRPKTTSVLREHGFIVHEGEGNFVMAKRAQHMPSVEVICDQLLQQGVIVRPLASFGLSECMRVSVGTKDEVAQLSQGLQRVIGRVPT